jgi:hemoglobin
MVEQAMAESIFTRYGGFAKVSRIVSDFYGRVLDSKIMGPYFENSDMRVLMDHQTKFIASMMGGPASYTNEHLSRVHAHLNINDAAFDEMVLLLRETLEDHDLSETDIGLVLREVTTRKAYVVIES